MINLIGSFYTYQGEQLASPEIIVVRDHHYNEESNSFPIEQLLKNSLCDPRDHVVVFDHVLQHDDVLKDFNLIYFPSFMARENREFLEQNIPVDWNNKTHTFNFMINKPRVHRIQLLELIKQFGLHNYRHSLAWTSNTVNDIAVTNYRFGPEITLERGIKNGSFRNARTYQELLRLNVFEPTCVSLITEPACFERETIITEKTLMAMWAGTMPIWVGGWRIADWLQSRGFDVFDDIVDHSYQHLPNPFDRCQQAIQLNLSLLKNFDLAYEYFVTNRARFQHNLDLLKSNFFKNECAKIINQTQDPVQLVLSNMLGVDKV
jgi:hypothetical protein